jgi:uncharacterized protein (TIGR02246 family)
MTTSSKIAMNKFTKWVFLAASMTALVTWANPTRSRSTPVTDESAIRAINPAWYKAYNTGDGASVAALYADDAVTGPPGAPAVRGKSAILEYFLKDAAAFAATGYLDSDGPASDLEISGDVAWQWGTYKITDKSGAVAATGKYLSVLRRRGKKWVIIRDIYNSDTSADGPLWTPR